MQQELHRVGAFVVAEEHRRFPVGELERLSARHVFGARAPVPVEPAASIHEIHRADIVILPDLRLGPGEHLSGRYPALIEWIRARYQAGACVYSACSGALMLAETGLLNGCDATSHWGHQDLFRRQCPQVRFRPEPNLCIADLTGRIVTAGGTTSWHELALHIISRHVNPGEAMRIAKVYLLKWHDERQLPYEPRSCVSNRTPML